MASSKSESFTDRGCIRSFPMLIASPAKLFHIPHTKLAIVHQGFCCPDFQDKKKSEQPTAYMALSSQTHLL